MEYTVERIFKVVNKEVSFEPYGGGQGTFYELKINIEFDKLINEDDYWYLLKNTEMLEEAMENIDEYIEENEEEIKEKLKLIKGETWGYNGFNTKHDRNKVSFGIVVKEDSNTLEKMTERLKTLYDEYREDVVDEEEGEESHPDLVIRLQKYLEANKEEVLKEHGEKVFEFLSKVENLDVYASEDPHWGTDYTVTVDSDGEHFEFTFMDTAESDVADFSEDDNHSVQVVFAKIPILWD